MAAEERNLTNEFRNALIEAKESTDGKRKQNTLNGLIDDFQTLQTEDKLKTVEIEEEKTATEPEPSSLDALKAFREFREKVESGQIQLPDMTLDEINEEIRLAREERAAREKAKK
jgi:hypothetical protein